MVAANPMVDIHMTSLIQSPYVQYHTSADVPDILSPWDMLHAGCLTAAFIYSVAHASYKDIVWFIDIVTRQGRQEIEEEMLSTVSAILDLDSKGEQEKTLEKLASLRARLQYKAERIIETQRSVLRIVQELQNIPEALKRQENEIKVNIAQQYDSVLSLLDKGYRDAAIGSTIIKELTPDEQKANSIVPRTVFPARVPMSEWSPEDRKKYKGDVISTSLFWVDGRRTLLEIARMVEQETGKSDVKALVEQFRLLEKNGHVKYDASMV